MAIVITGDGVSRQWAAAMKAVASGKAKKAMSRALNRAGDMSNTKVKRALSAEMGVKNLKVHKAVRPTKSSPARLQYELVGTGKHFSLIDSKGVSIRMVRGTFNGHPVMRQSVRAAAWNTPRRYAGAFTGHGAAGTTAGGGARHIFAREGEARFPLKKLWGPSVPREMVRGKAFEAFEATLAEALPRRLAHELGRLLDGKG